MNGRRSNLVDAAPAIARQALLPTPRATDVHGQRELTEDGRTTADTGPRLSEAIKALLPTPRAKDRGKRPHGQGSFLEVTMHELTRERESTSADSDRGRLALGSERQPARRVRLRHDADGRGGEGAAAWGRYWRAVEQWERILGERAPDPLDERGRMNGDLPRWMMGAPSGWLDGLSRTAAIRCAGNGVVVQVGEVAGRWLVQ